MKLASKDYIINTVFRTNILPVISECNTSCVFCSHRQNPEEVEVFKLPKLKVDDFYELLDFLSPDRKIVIGESATRIVEGEPLLHHDFLQIVELVRNRFWNTPIQITTNGILLTEALINELIRLGNIELNISVNCVDREKRKRVLGIKADKDISSILKLLKGKINYTGSMVYVPESLGAEDIEDVVALLDACGADAVRLFLPGYTDMAKAIPDFRTMHKDISVWVERLKEKYSVPILLEPSLIKDLACPVEGVIKNTPAWAAGIKPGDFIVEINGKETESRVDAFNRAYKSANPAIRLRRSGECFDVKLMKPKNSSPGFVVLYDIDTGIIHQIKKVIERNLIQRDNTREHNSGAKVWFMTSELASDIMKNLLGSRDLSLDYAVFAVKNRFFGGTIMCAGLLTVQDVITAIRKELEHRKKPGLILLPGIMFDFKNRDLLGRSMKAIEDEFGIPVDTV